MITDAEAGDDAYIAAIRERLRGLGDGRSDAHVLLFEVDALRLQLATATERVRELEEEIAAVKADRTTWQWRGEQAERRAGALRAALALLAPAPEPAP